MDKKYIIGGTITLFLFILVMFNEATSTEIEIGDITDGNCKVGTNYSLGFGFDTMETDIENQKRLYTLKYDVVQNGSWCELYLTEKGLLSTKVIECSQEAQDEFEEYRLNTGGTFTTNEYLMSECRGYYKLSVVTGRNWDNEREEFWS